MEKTCDRIGDSPPVVTDRISELPDSILHNILSLLPIKFATRTSVLSRRWRKVWEYLWIYADTLDLGEEFAMAQTQEQFVDAVNRYLLLNKRNKIHKFRLFFYPGTQHHVDAEKWIEFAIQRSVEVLDIDFNGRITNYYTTIMGEWMKLPNFLYSCESPLTHLKLGHCDFSPPLDFTGFRSLESLYLKRVSISDNALESILFNCPLLSELSLWECGGLNSIKILGPTQLQLKSLLVANCYDAYEIDILAPNLKSFHFCGSLFFGYSFQNVSALEDVYFNSTGFEFTEPEHDYIHILSSVSNIRILTICLGPLMYITTSEEYNPEALPVMLPNLQELQILIGVPLDEDCLGMAYGFFKHTICPCLEKLFIELSEFQYDLSWPPYLKEGEAEEPLSCWFYNLKTIKITNFHGTKTQMRLVKFFLSKSVSLVLLLLVAAQNSDLEKHIGHVNDCATTTAATTCQPNSSSIIAIHDQLLMLPKASNDCRILLCGNWDANSRSLIPKHNKYHCQPIP